MTCLCKRRRQGITRDIRIHQLGTINIYIKSNLHIRSEIIAVGLNIMKIRFGKIKKFFSYLMYGLICLTSKILSFFQINEI